MSGLFGPKPLDDSFSALQLRVVHRGLGEFIKMLSFLCLKPTLLNSPVLRKQITYMCNGGVGWEILISGMTHHGIGFQG